MLAAVRATLDALPHGVRALFRIMERPELDRLGAEPEAPLALAAIPGVIFSPDREGPATRAAHGAGHGYDPALNEMVTGFVAAGAGIRAGAVVPLLPLEHVAPLIAALLQLELPDIDGTLLPGCLRRPMKWRRPVDRRWIPASQEMFHLALLARLREGVAAIRGDEA